MRSSDRPRFANCISALAAAYRQESDEALLEGFWMALDDLAIGDIERAIRAALKTKRFMPTAVELRELSGEMTPAVRSVHAWQAFERAVIEHGAYKSMDFDDPVINATVRNLGGWQRVCLLPADEFDKFLRRDFERVYQALMTSGISPEAARPLIGEFDEHNQLHNYDRKALVRMITGLPPQSPEEVRIPSWRSEQPITQPGLLKNPDSEKVA